MAATAPTAPIAPPTAWPAAPNARTVPTGTCSRSPRRAELSLAARPSELTASRRRIPGSGAPLARHAGRRPRRWRQVDPERRTEDVPGRRRRETETAPSGRTGERGRSTHPTTAMPTFFGCPRSCCCTCCRPGPVAPATVGVVGERGTGDLHAEADDQGEQRCGQTGGSEPADRLPHPRLGAVAEGAGGRDRHGGGEDQEPGSRTSMISR